MSVEKQVETYCQKNPEVWHASGGLQRIEWKNSDGTLATPRSIVRRLQEMQNESVLAVRYVGRKHTPEYRWIPREWRARYVPSHSQGNDGKWQALQTNTGNKKTFIV